MADHVKVDRKVRDGLGTGVPNDPEAVKQAIAKVMTAPWVDVVEMSTALGVGRNVGYDEAKKGRFGAFKVGGQYRVPTAALREALRLTPAPVDQVAA